MAVWGSLLSVLLVLLMSTRSQGLLSDFKKCGDAECESLISRVQAIRDHKGPDCRFLNFKSGAVIFVYYKLAGQRDDLWAGSIDKQFGYFPRDAVEIEEVYVSNEVQIPAKETDFFCLDGSGYFTESESSHLESQEPHKPEVPASETGSSVKIGSKTEQNENVDSGKGEPGDSAEQLGQVNKDLKVAEQEGSRWLGSRVTGWLGLGSQEDDGEQKTAEQLSFKSRKIAMDFNDNAFKSDIDKETEPKKTGWLSGSLSNLMNFRGEAPEVLANNKPENADDKITAQHRKKATMTNTGEAGETEMEHNSQEEKAASDGSKSNWLNIGISDVLSFSRNSWNGNSKPKDGTLKEKYDGQVEDDKISSDGEQELNREETSTQIGEQRSIVPNTEKKDSTSHPDKETVEGETNMKGEKTDKYISGCTTDTCIQAEKTEEKNSDQGAKITEGTKEDSTLSSVMVRSNKGDEKSISTIGLPKGIKDTTRTMQTETEWPSESVQEGKDKTLSRNTTSQIILQLKEDASSQNDKTEGVSVVGRALHAMFEASSLLRPLWPRVQHFAKTAVSLLPEDMRPGPDMYGLPWEVVIVTAFVGILSALLFLCRFWQSIKSRLYVGREKKLATKVAELLEEKCKVLETLSECKQQYEKLDATLKNGGHSKQTSEKENLQVMSMKLKNSNSELKEEIDQLKQDLDSQRTTRAQQDELLAEMQRSLKSLEEEALGLKSQMEQAQTTLKIYQINSERLQTNLQAAKEENCQLQESKAQLVQEAEGWDERLNELAEQIKMCEESQKDMDMDCSNKDEQIKTLTDCLLKMKDWDSELEDDQTTQTENGEYLDHQKEQIQNLIYAVKLHAGLKSIEEDKNRIFTKLADEEKAKEDLKERIEKLKNDKDVLHSESMKYTSEAQKLQQKLKIMTEMYQENELKLHRKLTVEEKERTQKEEKLTKADEKIILAAEELSSYRQRAKDLEEERERTNQAYKNQIASHEKKAHDNWLAARAAERDLNEIKRENSHLRQRLTDSQFKLEMVEKDPYALDVPGRPQFRGERSPFGPSPLGRPASETRAFLSPPTLMDGPPRVSPAFPGVPGGRGYPYPDPTFPYRRPPPERGYPMPPLSGRLSGPAEIRGYSPLSADGSYLVNSLDNSGAAGNENKDSLLSMSGDLPLPSDAELRMDPGFGPPVMRGPLLPMDPRGHFPRRGPYGPSEFFPPRGPSGPLLCMRGPPPPGMFPRFPPPQLHPGYPPARYPTESASEPPLRPSPPTSEQPGEHAAPPPPQDII
ncbi:cTAGE family member 2-like isoform X2 [Acipenser ruthenus]|uniref:cTAGE family member 2-like isoform X2 n=1 Tax=Acipenser ruthenus TaxID=7906 RepID=UPI0027408C0C|nr:cTAGE family member 2-like isoform X2 [Acipenser ruthenus]